MHEITIILRYDSEYIEAIENNTIEAARFGWKMSDMLSAFTLYAATKQRTHKNVQYILVSKNGTTYWDILRDGEGSLLGGDSPAEKRLIDRLIHGASRSVRFLGIADERNRASAGRF